MRFRNLLAFLVATAGVPALPAHSDAADAIIALTSQIAGNPRDPALLLRRADCFEERGDPGLAEIDLRQASRLDPASTEVALRLCVFLLAHHRPAEASKPLSLVLAQTPNDPAALILRARLAAGAGQAKAAYADFTQALESLPEPRPELFLERAALPLDPAQVLAGVDEGLARVGPAVALVDRAIALELQLGRLEPALRRVDYLLAGSERKERLLKRRGDLLAAAGQTGRARIEYQAALRAIEALPAWIVASTECTELAAELRRSLRPVS